MHTFNSGSPATSRFVEGALDHDENAMTTSTLPFTKVPVSQHDLTNVRSSPEAFESRNNFSPPSYIAPAGAPLQRNLKWSEQCLVSPVESSEELLWCRTQHCPDPELVVGSSERGCNISITRRWPDGAHLPSPTSEHVELSTAQTGH
jgi:hypothetical protein